MKSVIKSREFWLSCALFCSQLTCGMATENQESQDNVTIGGRTVREYLNDKGFCRAEVRKDLEKLELGSILNLRNTVSKLSPSSERKIILYEEVDMFATLEDIIGEVNEWKESSKRGYEELFDEGGFMSNKDWEVHSKICWLNEMRWMEGWKDETAEGKRLKRECQSLKGELKKKNCL